MEHTSRITVIEGALSDFRLDEVLQIVSIGRQYTGVELRDARNSLAGTILVKSGKIVTASASGLTGRAAIYKMIEGSDLHSFHVYREAKPADLPEPIGQVDQLLVDLAARTQAASVAAEERVPPPPKIRVEARVQNTTTARRGGTAVAERPRTTTTGAAAVKRAPTTTQNPARAAGASEARKATTFTQAPSVTRAKASPAGDRPAEPGPIQPGPSQPGPIQPGPTHPGPAPRQDRASRATRTGHQGSDGRRTTSTLQRLLETGSAVRETPIVAIASAKGGSGKTTTALNLALSLARQQRSVVLVDGDINSDIMSAVDSRDRPHCGAYDVVLGTAEADDVALETAIPHLRIVPAFGRKLPDASGLMLDHTVEWNSLLRKLAENTELVIVDTPAGMFGETRQILSACTHVIGVLQAETIAQRSFNMFTTSLFTLPEDERPEVLGVVLNMLQASQPTSVSVLHRAGSELPAHWLFDTALPKNPAFLDASEDGVPLHMFDESNPPAVAWLFDCLAREVVDRLQLPVPARKKRRLLC